MTITTRRSSTWSTRRIGCPSRSASTAYVWTFSPVQSLPTSGRSTCDTGCYGAGRSSRMARVAGPGSRRCASRAFGIVTCVRCGPRSLRRITSRLITVESGIDGRRRNLERLPVYPAGTRFHPEVKWEKWARSKHLEEVARGYDDDAAYLEMRTIDTGITIGYAAALLASQPPQRRSVRQGYERIEEHADFRVGPDRRCGSTSWSRIFTSRDGVDTVRKSCLDSLAVHRGEGSTTPRSKAAAVWDEKWADC